MKSVINSVRAALDDIAISELESELRQMQYHLNREERVAHEIHAKSAAFMRSLHNQIKYDDVAPSGCAR